MFTSEAFVIKPEKGIVVCKMLVDPLNKDYLNSTSVYIESSNIFKKARVKYGTGYTFKVKAIARCSPEDTFNEKTGKALAEARARLKALKRTERLWKAIIKDVSNYQEWAIEKMGACSRGAKIEEERILRLIDELSK